MSIMVGVGRGACEGILVKDAAALERLERVTTLLVDKTGTLTDGTLEAQGEAAEGVQTTLHYADGLNTPRDNAFRLAYAKSYKLQPDVYAVQGYDAAQILGSGLAAVKGDVGKKAEFIAAARKARIDSPRGAFSLSAAHNPVQDIYLRQVSAKENKVIGVASKALTDPARGCKM